MNYYIDTEFIEDFMPPCLNLNRLRWEPQQHYVDLISIGIVAEDSREYYAVNKEFDLKHVWNKYELHLPELMGDEPFKEYWLRENVLRPIHRDLYANISGDMKNTDYFHDLSIFTYKSLRRLIAIYGKTKKQIAKEIQQFTSLMPVDSRQVLSPTSVECANGRYKPIFYGYYADYDWVVFCSLFGRMLDLPKGYPMYCRDLKQDMEVIGFTKAWKEKYVPGDNEHHALADARWNKKLHETLKIHAEALYHIKQNNSI